MVDLIAPFFYNSCAHSNLLTPTRLSHVKPQSRPIVQESRPAGIGDGRSSPNAGGARAIFPLHAQRLAAARRAEAALHSV